ncbi:condensation domain-containing protein, partial [Mesorhizobium japonicum]|uniref:condensation domain-containing protein n=1 Tax=Mesorhizobium japonicum TaxID=2066070 RepID=UPI003B5A4504
MWPPPPAGAPPPPHDPAGDLCPVELDAHLTAHLNALSRRHGVTLYTTMLAAWATVLTQLSGKDEVVIGSPTANRP